jgi:chaperonin GroEL
MLLRAHLEAGAKKVLHELERMTVPVVSKADLAGIAEAICSDQAMAVEIGEIFDIIGAFGHFELRSGSGRGLESEYVQGCYWEGKLHSPSQATIAGEGKATLNDSHILVTDLMVEDLHQLVHVITQAKRAGANGLVLVCNSISEACIGFLNSPQTRAVLPVIAVKTPGPRFEEQSAAMEDIAVLTGGQPITGHAGETLDAARAHHFGQARTIWANNQHFGISGGKGDPLRVKQHIHLQQSRHKALDAGDERELVRQRIGKMMGGSAVLWVGGISDAEIAVRKDMASRAAEAVRGAMLNGALPGGGMALTACQPLLKRAMDQAVDPDEKAAYRILLGAMEVPTRTILRNAGMNPDEIMALVKYTDGGRGYDVRQERVVLCGEPAFLDAASVVQFAAYRAITGAALLLTVDVLLRHKKLETVVDT